MKFGLLYEMETPRPWHALSEYNIYWEALAQIELADRIGLDYVWEVEHHFLEEYSHSPAPEVFYGAVTQRTKNIRIAHGQQFLQRIVEQLAEETVSNGIEFLRQATAAFERVRVENAARNGKGR